MKKKLIFILFVYIYCQKLFSFDFSGVWLLNRWYVDSKYCSSQELSWGIEQVPDNSFELIIDEEAKKIEISGIGIFPIKAIEKITDKEYILTYYFDRGDFDVKYKFLLQNEREFILENLSNSTCFVSDGTLAHYYRSSGPSNVEQYDKEIYAKYTGDGKKNRFLKINEIIRLIGIKPSSNFYQDDNSEYWYLNKNNEYGYVNVKSVEIINEK